MFRRENIMCRWLAYSGSPITPETVLLETEHSLIDQSLHARMGVQTNQWRRVRHWLE